MSPNISHTLTYNILIPVSVEGSNHVTDPRGMDYPTCHPSVAYDQWHVTMETSPVTSIYTYPLSMYSNTTRSNNNNNNTVLI